MASALFAFAFFFIVVGLAISRAGIVLTFAAATLAALFVQAATLKLAPRARPPHRVSRRQRNGRDEPGHSKGIDRDARRYFGASGPRSRQ